MVKRHADIKKLYRIIDANFNRAKEGLRVCEDVCRFIWDMPGVTRRFKLIRHRLTTAVEHLDIKRAMQSRNIGGDVGKASLSSESRRKDAAGIFYANAQRVKESIRVLEEFAKLFDPKIAVLLKNIRYTVYELEQTVVRKL